MGTRTDQPATTDAAMTQPDARSVDAPPQQVTVDASPDAGCAISEGLTPALDGTDDLAAYPSVQQLTPGAMLGSDGAAVAWDRAHLFITVSSSAFTSPYEPLHIYLQTGTTMATAAPATGKEYSGLTPALPFTPTQLIAIRRVSDSGTGGYDGVFVPTDGYTTRTLALDGETFASSDQRTLSVRVPWSALGGCPTELRLALHVVHAVAGNEWKDLVPSTHTPWQAPGGGYYEIDLSGSSAVTSWSLR